MARHNPKRDVVSIASFYDDASNETITFNVPENLADVADDDLDALLTQAQEAFEALDGDDINAEVVETMSALADAAEAIRIEQAQRAEALAEARAKADELREKIAPPVAQETEVADEEASDEEAEEMTDVIPEVTDEDIQKVIEEESVVASADDAKRKPISITVPGARRRRAPEPVEDTKPVGLSLVAAADLPGIAAGTNVPVGDVARAFLDRTRGINFAGMKQASKAGKRTVQSFGLGSFVKEFPDDLRVTGTSDVDAVLNRAVDSSRLPGGSLVASGAGWCSPSEVLYALAEEAETTDGVFSLPEVQVDRGGLKHTLGPDFQSVFGDPNVSWNFSESEVEDGDYDGYGGGSKPVYFVDCPEFTEDRLDVAGVIIRAGLLTNTAYPEIVENIVRKSLVTHEFKQARRKLERIIDGSTAVAMPAGQVGATAPILSAIEVQVEDYKQRHRVGRGRSLEAVFPYWVRGAIRADLSRRLGVDLLSVSNDQIQGYFAQRGVNAQFVYELDDLTGDAASRTEFPSEFKFLLYLEGTWIAGTQGVITLESVFDSALIEQNIYTQLFTEEGWLVAKRFHDSRVVTVNICANGATGAGVEIACDGSAEANG